MVECGTNDQLITPRGAHYNLDADKLIDTYIELWLATTTTVVAKCRTTKIPQIYVPTSSHSNLITTWQFSLFLLKWSFYAFAFLCDYDYNSVGHNYVSNLQ